MQTKVRKPLADYMNDPDIIDEPMPMREIHAIRLRIHDETKDMTLEEHIAYFSRAADKYGFKAITEDELKARLQRHKAAALTTAD